MCGRVFITILLFGILAGCGGGGGGTANGSQTGAAVFTILWPDRSKLIPAASNSIKITVSNTSGYSSTQIAPRPTQGNQSTVTFDNVPAGDLTATAVAY